ncbi:unnamed protein product, partial [Mesorhabditis belari]|uniref:Potassium channel domain-containing protein n=1 Tax=Mesorhabditis belari TaxID=2138241 RepID=A0AAF3EGJ9_9BILA
MGSAGVGRIFQHVRTRQATLQLPFSDLSFVATLPDEFLPAALFRTNSSRSHVSARFPKGPNPIAVIQDHGKEREFVGVHENIGRVKWDELRAGEEPLEEILPPKEPLWRRFLKLLKILLPHVGLNLLLLSYIAGGAGIFIWLEADHELVNRKQKLETIHRIYRKVVQQAQATCDRNVSMMEARLRPLLYELSSTHEYDDRFTKEGQLWTNYAENLETRWSFDAAVLYALTVITSTGYDHVTPTTDPGRIFTVFFGLLGIPLMFITAADIGKFLSEIVIRSYAKLLQIWEWISSVIEAIRDHLFASDVDSIDSVQLKKNRRRQTDEEGASEDEDERLQLPIASYFALIIGYCCIGSLLFNAFEKGPIWSFVHGLFFSFNTITTIGLGNIYVKSHWYLALVVVYVIIGLAVITASLDLCSSTLKRTFTKLHYFGRKIRGARGRFAHMSDDIREAMRLIAALKKTRASKDRITLEDLRRFLEVQEHLRKSPFVPHNVHLLRWIEDAYAQYMDEYSLNGRPPISPLAHKMSSSDPMLFF